LLVCTGLFFSRALDRIASKSVDTRHKKQVLRCAQDDNL
jgi:hypothetical protein